MNGLGEKIAKKRKDLGYTQAEFAEMLVPFAKNIVNMSIPTTYTCWFHDIEWLREWLSTAALQTCTMWLMWQWYYQDYFGEKNFDELNLIILIIFER